MNIELYNRFLKSTFNIVVSEQMEIDTVIYVKTGELIRRKDGRKFEIRNYIPRLVKDDNYTESFGYQWNKFRNLQHDSLNGKTLTEKRLISNTGWNKEKLAGMVVLECGCGPGRFTEQFYYMDAIIIAIDMSGAIDVNLSNLGLHPNILYIQDDITNLYYMKKKADYVFCYGVLQHTPDPHRTLHRLGQYAKPGGRLSVDVYRKMIQPNPFYGPKYFWRPITKNMNQEKLLKILQWYIPKYIGFDTKLRKYTVCGISIGKYILGIIPIPCWNYPKMGYSDKERVQHAIMDTFDALSPKYDRPCSYKELDIWAKKENYKEYKVAYGSNGLVLNAIR